MGLVLCLETEDCSWMIGNSLSFSISDFGCFLETLCEGELLGVSHKVWQSRRGEASRELWTPGSGTVNRHLEEGFFHTKELQATVDSEGICQEPQQGSKRAISASPEELGQFKTCPFCIT